jgi:hypothetical protein
MEKVELVFVGIIAAWCIAHLFVKSRSDDWWREHENDPKRNWRNDPFHEGGTIDCAVNILFSIILFGFGIASCSGLIDLSD